MEDERGDLRPPEGLISRAVRAGLGLTAALAVWAAGRLWAVCRGQDGVPMWDEAAHGLAGIEVAEALLRLDPWGFLQALDAQALWPFVHSLLLAPPFLLGGFGYASAEATSVALYAGTVILLYLAGTMLHPTRGPWIGLAAATLALLAPSYRVYGTLAFLEMPGAFLLTLAFTLHAWADRDRARLGRLRAAGVATTALFLCKYNYGALWLAAVAWWEWANLPREARARGWAALRRAILGHWWFRPVPTLLVGGVLAIVIILVTGGGSFTFLGQRVSARSPGNIPYALYLIWLAWMLLPRRERPSRAVALWTSMSARARVLVTTVFVPLAIWFALPGHLRELARFGANRDSGVPFWTAEGILFYPRALAADFSPVPLVGWIALLLVLWPAERERRVARLAWLAFLFTLEGTVLHRYRDSRFFFTACPMLWLCAADRASWLLERLLRLVPSPAVRRAVWAGTAVTIVAGAWIGIQATGDWPARRAALRAPADVAQALDAVLAQVEPSQIDAIVAQAPGAGRVVVRAPRREAALLGYANSLSPGLLAWHGRLARPDLAPRRLPRRVPTLDPEGGERALRQRLRWIDTHADVVIVALADPGDAEYDREIAGDRITLERLARDPRWMQRANARVGRFQIARFVRDR